MTQPFFSNWKGEYLGKFAAVCKNVLYEMNQWPEGCIRNRYIYIGEKRKESQEKQRQGDGKKECICRRDACWTTLQLGRIGRAYLLIYLYNCAAQIITGLVHANHKFNTVAVLAQT